MDVRWKLSGSSPWYPLLRLAAVVVTGGVVFGAALVGATSDPHGLAAASPIGGSQLAQLEPLYGAVWTPDASLDWSPDGRWIALGGGFVDGVMVVDAWTGNRVAAAQIPGIVETVRWSPDGTLIASEVVGLFGPGYVYILTVAGRVQGSWLAHDADYGSLDWSPDGTRIVTSSGHGFTIWDATTHASIYSVTPGDQSGFSVDWSPDGRLLAFGLDGGASIYDAATGRMISRTAVQGAGERRVEWSHNSQFLATASLNGCAGVMTASGEWVWSRYLLQSSCPGTIFGRRPAWDPTDSILAIPLPRGVFLVDAATGDVLRTLAFPVDRYGPSWGIGNYGVGDSRDADVEWSPQGNVIASTGSMTHPSLRLWGIPHRSIGWYAVAFETVFVAGIPLALGSTSRSLVGLRMRPPNGQPNRGTRIGLGGLFVIFATAIALEQSGFLDLVDRTYSARTLPPVPWVLTNLWVEALIFSFAAIAAIMVFHLVVARPRSNGTRLGMLDSIGWFGGAIVPIVWYTTLGFLVAAMALALAVPLPQSVLPAIIATFGGLGLAVSVAAEAPPSRVRFVSAILLATAASFAALPAMLFGILTTVAPLLRVIPWELRVYGFTVGFSFGLMPVVWAAAFLLVTASGMAVLASPPRFWLPLFARLRRNDILDLDTRRRVLDILRERPGIHFRELLRTASLGSGTLSYHLYVLEREGFVIARRDGMYRRFFAAAADVAPKTS